MERYVLFGGDQYYPLGGWQDFKGSFGSREAAVREAAGWGWDWWQVVDLMTGDIVDAHTPR